MLTILWNTPGISSGAREKIAVLNHNYYQATQNQQITCSSLQEDETADVAVIGGGLTGISAALNLAERGHSVVLLEAQEIGWGASGRNGGQIVPGLAIDQIALEKLVGREDARALWDFSLRAIDTIADRVAKHQIECDLRWGYLHAAVKPRQVRELQEWQTQLAELGHSETRLLSKDALLAELNSPRYQAALLDPKGGHLHPLNYTLGLAKAAQNAGARLYTHSPVTQVTPGQRAQIKTVTGSISAKFLLLCGNAYLGGLMPAISPYVMPVGTYIIATEALGTDRATSLIGHNAAVADLNFVLDYFRLSADTRLLFGGRVSYSAITQTNLGESMLRRMRQVFPQLADVRGEYVWGGNVAITRNRAPHFGRLTDNVYFAHGFSGHGVALTGLAGTLLADLVDKQAADFDVFARIPHQKFPGGQAFRTPALILATTYFRLRDFL